jgi:hypothetical protein
MNSQGKTRTNYVFIDYENVQPPSLFLAGDYPFKIILFVGANQTKIPIDLAIDDKKVHDKLTNQ